MRAKSPPSQTTTQKRKKQHGIKNKSTKKQVVSVGHPQTNEERNTLKTPGCKPNMLAYLNLPPESPHKKATSSPDAPDANHSTKAIQALPKTKKDQGFARGFGL
jgi:hypothetical protein